MTRAQITLVQIDNYGPWTVTPEPRREADLQTLQARLYADLSQAFGAHDAQAFYTRFDNVIAVSNGVDADAHARIQESIANRYPVTVSLGVGTGETPVAALAEATDAIQAAGSAQDEGRQEVLRGAGLDDARRDDVHFAHFDVNDATSKYTDELNAYDSLVRMEEAYTALMRYMREKHEALAFFVGGDNMIATCPDLSDADYLSALEYVEDEVGIELKVGVGTGATAHEAGMGAKEALEACRHDGSRVERAAVQASSD